MHFRSKSTIPSNNVSFKKLKTVVQPFEKICCFVQHIFHYVFFLDVSILKKYLKWVGARYGTIILKILVQCLV